MNISPTAQQRSMSAYGASEKKTTQVDDKENVPVKEKVPVKDNTTDEAEKVDHTLGDKATNSINSGNNLTMDPFLEEIAKNQKLKMDEVQKLIDKNANKLKIYEDFDTILKEFQKISDELVYSDNNAIQQATVDSETSAFSAVPTGKAPNGKFVIEVQKAAKNHQLKSHELAGLKTELGDSTADTRTLTIKLANGKSFDIELKTSQTSPLEISKAINSAKIGVNARVIQSSDDHSYLTISSIETGTDSAIESIKVTNDDTLNKELEYPSTTTGPDAKGMEEIQPAQNSEFTIDGITITSQKNKIDNAIEGITFNLDKATDKPITVTIDTDNAAFVEKVTDWLLHYNMLKKLENQATHISPDPDKAGVLSYNNPLSNFMRTIEKVMDMRFDNGAINNLMDAQFEKKYDKNDPKDPTNTNGFIYAKEGDSVTKVIQNNMAEFKQLFMGNDKHKGLAGEMKETIDKEFNGRSMGISALSQTQDSIKKDNKKLAEKIDTIKESTTVKIEKLKVQFARLQDAMTKFNDATNYFKLMSGSKN